MHVFGHVHAGYGQEYVFWDEAQKIYERLCAREEEGAIRDIIAVVAWIELVRLIVYGTLGIVWSKIWGGDGGGSVMVNSALMYRSSGKLSNIPQVVDI